MSLRKEQEQCLVREACEGSSAAFQRLHETYRNKVFNFLVRFMKDRSQAEEATQETFIQAYLSLSKLNDMTKFKSWLYTIAANKARNAIRKKKREPIRVQEVKIQDYEKEDSLDILSQIPDESQRPDQVTQKAELFQKLQTCIHRLPEKYRMVLILCDVEGMSYREAAEALRRAPNDIGTILHRARRKIREWINLDEYDIKFFLATPFARLRDQFASSALAYILYRREASFLIDGELSMRRKRVLEQILMHNLRLSRDVAELEKLKIALDLLPHFQVSASYGRVFQKRFEDALAAQESRSIWNHVQDLSQSLFDRLRPVLWEGWPVRLGWAMALALVVVVSWQQLTHTPQTFQYAAYGTVRTYDHKAQQWTALKDMQHAQKIETDAKSFADLTFGTLYGLRLQENSRIFIHQLIQEKGQRRVDLEILAGSLLAKIGDEFKQQNREFHLRLGKATLVVTGTAFAVHKDSEEAFRVELVSGQASILDETQIRHTLTAYQWARIQDGRLVSIQEMDILRANELMSQINIISPRTNIPFLQIFDLRSETFLPQSPSRIHNALTHFSIKLMGKDESRVRQALHRIQSEPDPDQAKKLRDAFLDYFEKNHADWDVTAEMFLYLASHAIQQKQYAVAQDILKRVVHLQNKTWSSLALCMRGYVYETFMDDPQAAQEAYQQVLQDFPQSLEAEEAKKHLTSTSPR